MHTWKFSTDKQQLLLAVSTIYNYSSNGNDNDDDDGQEEGEEKQK